MLLKELLAGVAKRNELMTVPVPDLGDGAELTFRTRLSVADVLALPPNFLDLPAFVRNALLFRLLVRDPTGALPDVDDDEFAGADAMWMHRVVVDSGLDVKVFEQLVAREADDEGEEDAGGKKPGV